MSTESPTIDQPSNPGSPGHIVIKAGYCGGKPHIDGHRIKVQHVAIWNERMGMSPDEIAANYGLSLSQVYAALAYYWEHKDQIDADIKEGREFADALRAGAASIFENARRRNGADDSLPPG